MLALQLVQSRPRGTRFARLPLALAIYALYYNLLGVGRSWVEQEKMSSFWWVPGLLLIVLIALWMVGRRGER
jgi:lipopolysaccharide export system permease protein